MSVLNGIAIQGDETIHTLDYENGVANKPFEVLGMVDVNVVASNTFPFTTDPLFGDNGVYSYIPNINPGAAYMFVLEKGKEYKVVWDNVEYTCTCKEYAFQGLPAYAIGNANIIGFTEEATEPFLIAYMRDMPDLPNYCGLLTLDTSASHNVRIYYQEEDIKKIDGKFVKDMYYSEEGGEETLLEPTEFTFSNKQSLIAENPTFIPVAGKTYTITFDNVEYECVAKDLSAVAGIPMIVVGNMGIEEGFEDTGEPFAIAYMVEDESSALLCLVNDDSTTHSVGIRVAVEIIHQIPSRYVDGYTRAEIDTMFGAYVDEVDALLGGTE